MILTVKDVDAPYWSVTDAETGELIRGVQLVNDETGYLERILILPNGQVSLAPGQQPIMISEIRKIKLIKKEKPPIQ